MSSRRRKCAVYVQDKYTIHPSLDLSSDFRGLEMADCLLLSHHGCHNASFRHQILELFPLLDVLGIRLRLSVDHRLIRSIGFGCDGSSFLSRLSTLTNRLHRALGTLHDPGGLSSSRRPLTRRSGRTRLRCLWHLQYNDHAIPFLKLGFPLELGLLESRLTTGQWRLVAENRLDVCLLLRIVDRDVLLLEVIWCIKIRSDRGTWGLHWLLRHLCVLLS